MRFQFRDDVGAIRARANAPGIRRANARRMETRAALESNSRARSIQSKRATQPLDFLPGTLTSRLVNARALTMDWRALIALSEKINDAKEDLSAQPTLGLIRGELKMCANEETLARREQSYKEYVLQRTLGMKAALTLATNEATKNAKRRCAIGRALSDPTNDRSLFALYAKRATNAGVDAFVGGLALDLIDIDRALSANDLATTKNWYGANVTEGHFEFVEKQVERAVESVAKAKAGDSVKVVPVLVPSMDASKFAGDALASEDTSKANTDEPDFMFGKKSKKNKNKKPADSKTTNAAFAIDPSTMLPQFAADALKQMSAKFGTEPAFPEIEAWGQSTSSEASGAVLALIARAPANCAVILPSALFKVTLTFDLERANSRGARAFAVEDVAASDWRASNPDIDRALWVSIDPNPIEGDWRAPRFAAALATCASASIPVVIASMALIPEAPTCDAHDGPPEAVAVAAGASARAHERVANASPPSVVPA